MAENLDELLEPLRSIASTLSEIKDKVGGKPTPDPDDKRKKENDKAQANFAAKINNASDSLMKLGTEINKIAEAGLKLANTLGTTATRGIQTELNNRKAIFTSIFTVEANRIVSAQELAAAESALATTFSNVAAGMEIDAEGVRKFGEALKGGFKSEFQLTGESMRALITAGVSTEQGFENLRKASGRASLNHIQLANLVNKNSLSFMLYGPKFIKAAQQAERLGISLASVQSAQESMVTNLDGTIDTIAQINQLGGQVDFGKLTQINEFEGPEATLKYLQSTIPPSLFQSASTRALLKGFGISVEDLMKRQGSAQDQAAANMEKTLSKLEEPVGNISKILTEVVKRFNAFSDSFGGVIMGFLKFAFAMIGAVVAARSLTTVLGALAISMVNKTFGTSLKLPGAPGAGGATIPPVPPTTPPTSPTVPPTVAGGKAGFMSTPSATLLAGAAAMLVVATALYVTAKAAQEFMKVDWNAMKLAGVALLGLTTSVLALGLVMSNPVGATAMLAGAAAMLVIGGALYVVAKAISAAAPGLTALGNMVATAFGGFATAANALSNVFKVLSEMTASQILSLAMALPVLYKAISELGDVLKTFPTTKLDDISSKFAKFSNTEQMAIGIRNFIAAIKELANVDLKKLQEIANLMQRISTARITVPAPAMLPAGPPVTTPGGMPPANLVSSSLLAGTVTVIPRLSGSEGIPMSRPVLQSQTRPAIPMTPGLPTPTVPSVGAISQQQPNTELVRKVDELILTLKNAKTVINVDNKIEEVPRGAVVGVYTRNERR